MTHLRLASRVRPSLLAPTSYYPVLPRTYAAVSVSATRTFLFSRSIIPTQANAAPETIPLPSSAVVSEIQPTPTASTLIAPVPSASAPTPSTSVHVAEAVDPATKIIDPQISTEFANALDTVIANAADLPAPDVPVLTAITQIGDLTSLGLGGYGPVGIMQGMFEAVYVTTGLPWWATIASCTVFLRLALFPVVVKSQRVSGQMANLKPLLKPIQDELQLLKASGADRSKQFPVMRKMQDVYKDAGVNPLGGLWGLVQMPVFISVFFGLRGMADLPVPGFTTGGALWFHDLTLMDPTYILPIVASGTMLVVMEYGMEMQAAANPSQAALMKNLFRFMLVAFIPFTAAMPAAVFVYWVTSNFLTLIQFLVLKNPAVRKALGIPLLKTFPAQGNGQVAIGNAVSTDGMLAVKPMKFGEAWKMVKEEAERRKIGSKHVL
ncbi:60Kd inner membrane protein-domain-containing protein [Chytriomyces cf. hyalinus JEL632]|nr:60Kd inner membrane protein-domain-containing protein [Chytriomyces cf. hyalinus JEL632]